GQRLRRGWPRKGSQEPNRRGLPGGRGSSVRQGVDDPGEDQVDDKAGDDDAHHRHHFEPGADRAPGQPEIDDQSDPTDQPSDQATDADQPDRQQCEHQLPPSETSELSEPISLRNRLLVSAVQWLPHVNLPSTNWQVSMAQPDSMMPGRSRSPG